MLRKHFLRSLFLVIVVAGTLPISALAATLAVTPIGASPSTGMSETYGFTFTPTSSFTIVALGVYNDGSSHSVGLWENTSPYLLSEVTVDPADHTTFIVGDFRFITLATPIQVVAGQAYEVGAEMSGDILQTGHTNVTLDPRLGNLTVGGIGTVDPEFGIGNNNPGYLFTCPVTSMNARGGYWAFGGNFLIADNAVPEPCTLLLLGIGLGGVALASWRRSK